MKLKTTALAAIMAASVGTVALADAHSPTMGQGLNMLQVALLNDFERMDIPREAIFDLTLGEIAAIKQIVESDDNDGQKKGRIEAIIGN